MAERLGIGAPTRLPPRRRGRFNPGSTPCPMPQAEILPSGLWRGLLAPGIAAYETNNFTHAPPLHPQERLAVRDAVPKRVAEFAAGRACAHRALAALGCAPAPLPKGADRSPVWPQGIVGSITHTDGYCAAAVAWRRDIAGIGIDAEIIGRVDEDVQRLVCTPAERRVLAAMAEAPRAEAATILFSAKEAFFKCQSGAGGALPDFQDIELQWRDGAFSVAPCRGFAPARPGRLQGRYRIEAGRVLAGIIFPAG